MSCEVDDALVPISTSSTLWMLGCCAFNGYRKASMTILVSPIFSQCYDEASGSSGRTSNSMAIIASVCFRLTKSQTIVLSTYPDVMHMFMNLLCRI